MVGLYPGGALEFSTYGTSQKVVDLERNPAAACVVAPVDGDRALVLRGTLHGGRGQHEPTTGGDDAPVDVPVADGIGERRAGPHAVGQAGRAAVHPRRREVRPRRRAP